MAVIFLTPEEGTYSSPCLPPEWLWAYAPEPVDDIFFVHQPSGNTQWEYPGDDVTCGNFWYWLSEQFKVDDDGTVAGAPSVGTRGLDGPTGDRAFHGFGRPQKPSSSGQKMSFKERFQNFFVGDFKYRPPPRPPAPHSSVKPGQPWRPWKEEEGMYVGAPVANPGKITPFPCAPTPANSASSHHGHGGAALSPSPSNASQYSQWSQYSQSTQGADLTPRPSNASQWAPQGGANLSPQPSVSSQYSTYGGSGSFQSHETHQSFAPSLVSNSSSTPSTYIASPSSPNPQRPQPQQWQSAPSVNAPPAYATQTQLPKPQLQAPPAYHLPPTSTAMDYRPTAAHAQFHGYVPPTINAGAFKVRPREMEDGPDGPSGGTDAGYWSDPQQQYASNGIPNTSDWQQPSPGGHANSYYATPTQNNHYLGTQGSY